jgi:hypothetical protein
LLSGFFGGKREKGGRVKAGKAHLVGEDGPEPFIPDRPGIILPNSVLNQKPMGSGSSQTILSMPISINAPGADAAKLEGVRQELQSLKGAIPKIIESTVTRKQIRGTRA